MVGVLVLAHWFACVWRLQASFQPSMLDSWLGKDHVYCQPDDSGPSGVACMGATQLYVAALYWASTTITSVGYGDITPTPGNLTCSSPPSASLGLSASPHLASLHLIPMHSTHFTYYLTSPRFPFHFTSHPISPNLAYLFRARRKHIRASRRTRPPAARFCGLGAGAGDNRLRALTHR